MAPSAIVASLFLLTAPSLSEPIAPDWLPDSSRALQTEPTTTTAGTSTAPSAPLGSSSVDKHRINLMELNFRARYLSVPASVLDIWYFDSDDEGANAFDRPKGRGYALGVEYVIKQRPVNWFFYYEYIGNLMDEGYWDDVEEPAEHEDGDWIRPADFGMHVLGANFGHEVELTPSDRQVWLSMIFGAGLGVAIVEGELNQWHPGGNESNTERECGTQEAAYDRYTHCSADGTKRIPGVLPMVDISGSARVNFGDRANMRLDFGIHDMLYIGGAMGGVF